MKITALSSRPVLISEEPITPEIARNIRNIASLETASRRYRTSEEFRATLFKAQGFFFFTADETLKTEGPHKILLDGSHKSVTSEEFSLLNPQEKAFHKPGKGRVVIGIRYNTPSYTPSPLYVTTTGPLMAAKYLLVEVSSEPELTIELSGKASEIMPLLESLRK